MLSWLYIKLEFFINHIELIFVPLTWFLCFLVGVVESSIYAVLSLILLFLLSACIFIFYFKLSFLGILLIIIYVGALAVLFLFIVMMVPVEEEVKLIKTKNFFFYFFFFILFLLTVVWLFLGSVILTFDYANYEIVDEIMQEYRWNHSRQYIITNNPDKINWNDLINNDIAIIGKVLYGKFSLLLILCSLLLFYALAVAIIFSQDKE